MKELVIEWRHYEKEGATCDRCSATGSSIAAVVSELSAELATKGIAVRFLETPLPEAMLAQSNLILFNGVPLEALLEQTDTLSVHVPLTPETRGMINAAALARLPKGAVVVNTARGPIVDIDALGAALKSGHLSGVGIDVVPVEPPVEPVAEDGGGEEMLVP